MKKLLSISMGALLTIFAAACSNDDEIVPAEQSDGESAYISVRISGTGAAGTRAATTDDDLEYGLDAEQKVNTATFYFYNTDGHLVAASEVTSLSNEKKGDNIGSKNVEYMGEAVVKVSVAKTSIATIKNLVTVINAPSSFVAKSTLSDLEDEITDGYLNGDAFVMSTSTYQRTNDEKSFVTVIADPEKSFKTSRTDAESADNADVVDVYVERLAVKVRVNVDIPATVDDVTRKVEVGGKTIYKLGSDFTLVEADASSESGYSVKYNQAFYARLRGWGLNATTKNSTMMKRISSSWTATTPFADWNDATRFRSYWGMSYNYGSNNFLYPSRYKDDEVKTIYTPNVKYASDATDSCLDYISATQILNGFGADSYDYCNENTNSYSVFQTHSYAPTSIATNVLVRATLVDANNKHLSLLRRAGGMYFTYDGFIAYALDSWKKSNSDVTKFRIDGKEITAANLGIAVDSYLNGRACIKVKKNQGTVTKINDQGAEEASSDEALNAALRTFTETNYALQYKNGDMYYSVPIKHLNENSEAEGYYGVVRNHFYDLTINDITAPGHGINVPGTPQPDPEDEDETIDTPDPDAPDDGDTPDEEDPNDPDPDDPDPDDPGTGEPIIPNDDENEYYLKAKVNILSWRVVTHTVALGK